MNSNLVCQSSTADSVKEIDLLRLPEHVAIIMDGNRRWAKRRKVSTLRGHYEGAEALTRIVRFAGELGIKRLTVYAFSTENWSRSTQEVKALMSLFKVYLLTKREMMFKEGVKLDAIGDLSRLPKEVLRIFLKTQEVTKDNNKINLILALSYGGRSEIVRAFQRMLTDYDNKKFSKGDVDESFFSSYLDTRSWKDPDLLIRTSGELRISNFLLWQISYTEIHISDALWPDFSKEDFIKAISDFQTRKRRLGG